MEVGLVSAHLTGAPLFDSPAYEICALARCNCILGLQFYVNDHNHDHDHINHHSQVPNHGHDHSRPSYHVYCYDHSHFLICVALNLLTVKDIASYLLFI